MPDRFSLILIVSIGRTVVVLLQSYLANCWHRLIAASLSPIVWIRTFFTAVNARRPRRFFELSKLVEWFDSKERHPDVLYLGDSVLERVSWNDSGQINLGETVVSGLKGKLRGVYLSHSAYHMHVYFHLLRTLSVTRNKPKMVILPVNMRSFSPQWELCPLWQFELEMQAIHSYLEFPKKGVPRIQNYRDDQTAMRQYERTAVEYPCSSLKSIHEFRELIQSNPENDAQKVNRLKEIFIFHYMHPLAKAHSRLLRLLEIINFLRNNDIGLFAYVTPVNFEAAERLLGQSFVEQYCANTKLLMELANSCFSENHGSIKDYSMMLTSENFFHEYNATEHLNENGRRVLAGKLVADVLDLAQRRRLLG